MERCRARCLTKVQLLLGSVPASKLPVLWPLQSPRVRVPVRSTTCANKLCKRSSELCNAFRARTQRAPRLEFKSPCAARGCAPRPICTARRAQAVLELARALLTRALRVRSRARSAAGDAVVRSARGTAPLRSRFHQSPGETRRTSKHATTGGCMLGSEARRPCPETRIPCVARASVFTFVKRAVGPLAAPRPACSNADPAGANARGPRSPLATRL